MLPVDTDRLLTLAMLCMPPRVTGGERPVRVTDDETVDAEMTGLRGVKEASEAMGSELGPAPLSEEEGSPEEEVEEPDGAAAIAIGRQSVFSLLRHRLNNWLMSCLLFPFECLKWQTFTLDTLCQRVHLKLKIHLKNRNYMPTSLLEE